MRNVADVRNVSMGACSQYWHFLMAAIWRKPYSEKKRSGFELHFSMKVSYAEKETGNVSGNSALLVSSLISL